MVKSNPARRLPAANSVHNSSSGQAPKTQFHGAGGNLHNRVSITPASISLQRRAVSNSWPNRRLDRVMAS